MQQLHNVTGFLEASDCRGYEHLDVWEALLAHVRWKQRLLSCIRGGGEEMLEPETVNGDSLCKLGRWLHGYGGIVYGENARFAELKALHTEFHQQAADIVRTVQQGQAEVALNLLQTGGYATIANRMSVHLARISLASSSVDGD